MIEASVQAALVNLRTERDRLEGAITTLEQLVNGGGGAVSKRRGRPPKARAGQPGRKPAGARRSGKNAPRGLLQEKIRAVLKAAKKTLAPVDLRNGVMEAGYPNKNPKTLYTAIFATAKKDPTVKKTKEGFSLK